MTFLCLHRDRVDTVECWRPGGRPGGGPVVRVRDEHAYWGRPASGSSTAVLVVSGSSGRIDTERVDMLAGRGVTALGVRWFGGPGLPAVPLEVPLEYFTAAVDLLLREADRVVLLGVSYGAEAVLLTATVDARPAATVALAPTDVAWEGQASAADDPVRPKWTWGGEPVPFVPLDRAWFRPPGPPAFVDFYTHCLERADPDVVEAARIPVERIPGDLVLVAGGDDKVWAALPMALRILERRRAHGLDTTLVEDPRAGHPVVLPGEAAPDLTRPYQVGGDAGGPVRLGELAWPAMARVLGLRPPDRR